MSFSTADHYIAVSSADPDQFYLYTHGGTRYLVRVLGPNNTGTKFECLVEGTKHGDKGKIGLVVFLNPHDYLHTIAEMEALAWMIE